MLITLSIYTGDFLSLIKGVSSPTPLKDTHNLRGFLQTTKEKNMWSCEWSGRYVEITVELCAVDHRVSSMRLWNYNSPGCAVNRPLSGVAAGTTAAAAMVSTPRGDLQQGVKDFQVWINDRLVHDGALDIGSGDQVCMYIYVCICMCINAIF